jgi:enamine deaminase RidA (YjgF/YER057c/UK114 family)
MEFLQPASWPRPKGYANGVAAKGRMVFVSGMVGWDADGVFPQRRFRRPGAPGARERDSRARRGEGAARAHRSDDVVRDRQAGVRCAYPRIGAAYRELIGRHFPAMTAVEVRALIEDAAKVEIEVTAVIPD